ncbi:unnamed protein product [Nyctereutes procyonoides]|uniref:(raccoon dog) hypothetical protein n=1 Tax=Nyctereutes procyonoides TaxID=34880 RepID=A0A811YUY5_NYCPR|nr:unnamed protein product [Nyctereutes procyonoides]
MTLTQAARPLPPPSAFSIKNRYGFNRNDTEEDGFVHQTVIKKYLRGVGDGETVESDVEGGKDVEAANVKGSGRATVQGSKYAATITIIHTILRRGPPSNYPENDQNCESEDSWESAPEGQASMNQPWGQPQSSNPPVQGEVLEGADQQGAKQERGNEEDTENQGDETQSQQPSQHQYLCNFNNPHRYPENPNHHHGRDKSSLSTS